MQYQLSQGTYAPHASMHAEREVHQHLKLATAADHANLERLLATRPRRWPRSPPRGFI